MLSRIAIQNFRNFSSLELDFSPGATLFWGKNGQGKTNLLEAVYYLSALRSFRQVASPQLIKKDSSFFEIKGTLADNAQDDLQIRYDPEKKRALEINGNRVTRVVDFAGRLNCVILYPGDLKLARGRHNERLRWLDFSIAQIEPSYLQILARFQRNLKLRNAALKQRVSHSELEALSENFVIVSQSVVERRLRHWPALRDRVIQTYQEIGRAQETFSAVYQSEVEENMLRKLAEKNPKELEAGTTLLGPHRDQITLTLDHLDVSHGSSEGQARTIALAFKIAQARFIRDILGRPPVLLIDDVWGELDGARREGLQKLMLESPQILLTATDRSREAIPQINRLATEWKVSSGKLSKGHTEGQTKK